MTHGVNTAAVFTAHHAESAGLVRCHIENLLEAGINLKIDILRL
jgi:hypothetical protein